MRTKRITCTASLLVLFGALTSTTTADVLETFDGGANPSGWSWGFANSIPGAGGNPGAYLRTDGLDTFAPQPRPMVPSSPFHGNYREAGVTCIGVDLKTFAVDFSADGRPLTLMLLHNNNTPGNPLDDTAAYFMHAQNVPLPGQPWLSYEFDVPSEATQLPPGWALLNMGDSGAPANHTWDQVIQHVSNMRFFYGNPEFFFIFQQWTLGLDNPRICIEKGEPCVADLVGDDGIVDIDDLFFVIAEYGNPGGPADIAPPGGNGAVDIDDLFEVIGAWGDCP